MSEKQQHQESPEDENKLIAKRREKLNIIKEKRNAFPNDFRRQDVSLALHTAYGESDKETLEGK
ncbi:MAG: lysine--tRNA ligase, partial [Pseudomonadales bacterium]